MRNEKIYEFRRTIFRSKDIERVFIYSTSPEKKIIGHFAVGDIYQGTPEELWFRFSGQSGLTDPEFFEYFKGCGKGYAIKIEDFVRFAEPLDPVEAIPGFVPPQSFQYLDSDIEGQTPSQIVS